jgi:hypothetical protein
VFCFDISHMCVYLHVCLMPSGTHTHTHMHTHTQRWSQDCAHAKEEKEKKFLCIHANKKGYTRKKKVLCSYTQSGDSIHGSCERREGKEQEKNLLCIHAERRFYTRIMRTKRRKRKRKKSPVHTRRAEILYMDHLYGHTLIFKTHTN